MAVASPRPLPAAPTVIVLRALPGLGDWLCAVPTLRALRGARPSARIHLVGLPESRPLVGRFRDLVDAFHAFPGWPGLPEQPLEARAVPGFLAALQDLQADLAIQLHGSGEHTNELVELFGAAQVAGFHRPGARLPDPAAFLEWRETEPEVRRGLRLLTHLGIRSRDERLSFPLDAGSRAAALALLESSGIGAPFAVIHPGGRRPSERWPEAGFAEVGRDLARRGLGVVVTGDARETDLTASVARSIPDAVDLGGRTDLDCLGWILRACDLLVANDTGVAHLGDALDVRSVVVFGSDDGSRAARWAPLDARHHRAAAGTIEAVTGAIEAVLRPAGRRRSSPVFAPLPTPGAPA